MPCRGSPRRSPTSEVRGSRRSAPRIHRCCSDLLRLRRPVESTTPNPPVARCLRNCVYATEAPRPCCRCAPASRSSTATTASGTARASSSRLWTSGPAPSPPSWSCTWCWTLKHSQDPADPAPAPASPPSAPALHPDLSLVAEPGGVLVRPPDATPALSRLVPQHPRARTQSSATWPPPSSGGCWRGKEPEGGLPMGESTACAVLELGDDLPGASRKAARWATAEGSVVRPPRRSKSPAPQNRRGFGTYRTRFRQSPGRRLWCARGRCNGCRAALRWNGSGRTGNAGAASDRSAPGPVPQGIPRASPPWPCTRVDDRPPAR